MRIAGPGWRGAGRVLGLCLLTQCLPATAWSQGLPALPLSFGHGRVVVSGDLAASGAPEDLGFFNYSDYEHSTLRELRVGLGAEVKVNRRLALLGEVRTGELSHLHLFSFFARVQPWPDRRLSIQMGRIPPTFGAYTRRTYSRDNPLIGYPMAYQYLISLRTDAVPVSGDDLVRMRGRGWLSAFSAGAATLDRGVPLVTVFSRDTGIQVSGGRGPVDVSAAVTAGSPSNPQLHDGNSGVTVTTRATLTAAPGLQFGASYASGTFLPDRLSALGSRPQRGGQRVGGLDMEAAAGPWVTRADLVVSEWRMPVINQPALIAPLRAVVAALEVRRNLVPGFYVAGRAERLLFNTVPTSLGRTSWEAPVTRVELGAGYALLRNLVARTSLQFNRRDGGRVRSNVLPAAQLLFWF